MKKLWISTRLLNGDHSPEHAQRIYDNRHDHNFFEDDFKGRALNIFGNKDITDFQQAKLFYLNGDIVTEC